VKLFLRFAGQQGGTSWAMATGWLIEPDLLVTAGHCANDWSHNYGKLTHVKAYIGYTGKEAVSEANQVQMRMGIKVATTESWLTKGDTDSRGDVSFICLNKPFTGVTPFKYVPTPMTGVNERIGVVGYPGDLMKRGTGEKGAVGHYELYVWETICLPCAAHVRNVCPNQLHT
jgi:V8-like Glu-specific endopeptidase